jgi:predicted DNA-binding transcriptional regulator YafY
VRYSDEHDPYAAAALERLAEIMPEPVREQVRAAVRAIERRPFDTAFARVLQTVTDAWARRRVLRLSYRSAGKQRPREVILEPYFLEPSAAGFSTYLIGYSRTHRAMRTFKVERIVSADVLAQTFSLPEDLRIDELLSSAWGIVWGEGVQVRLRFSPDVAWRVRESRWHPSQILEPLEDGGCLLTVSVASLLELGRWVRSWGDRVEVLSPASLRQELRTEAVRLARLYASPPKVPRQLRRVAPGRPGSVA